MFQILFISYFCFYFTFTVYTNVLNTVVFIIRKGKKKAVSKPILSPLLKFSLFSNPLVFQPSRLLVFDFFFQPPVYQRPESKEKTSSRIIQVPLHWPLGNLGIDISASTLALALSSTLQKSSFYHASEFLEKQNIYGLSCTQSFDISVLYNTYSSRISYSSTRSPLVFQKKGSLNFRKDPSISVFEKIAAPKYFRNFPVKYFCLYKQAFLGVFRIALSNSDSVKSLFLPK